MRRLPLSALAALATATTLLTSCGSSHSGDIATKGTTPGASASAPAPNGGITVLAAASLTESFTTLGHQFEATHPGTKVVLSFGASSTLATQIAQGAPADVFASASPKNMDQVIAAKDATVSKVFAKNVPEIAVPRSNPAHLATVADLAKPGVKVALCAPTVPIGALTQQLFAKAGVNVRPATIEPDVKATLTKVALGEVDAGIVYVTDVRAAGTTVTGIPIPTSLSGSTKYPIATLTRTKNAALAEAFVDYVLSADGTAVLATAGFEKPLQ